MSKYYIDPATGQRVEIQKTHKVRNFVVLPIAGMFALGIVLSAATSGGASQTTPNTVPASPAAEATHDSQVQVTGSSGQVTLGVMSNGMATNTVEVPHTQQLPQGFVTVSVTRSPSLESYQNGGHGDAGTVTCTITRDGKVVDTKTATGQFASVSCSKSY